MLMRTQQGSTCRKGSIGAPRRPLCDGHIYPCQTRLASPYCSHAAPGSRVLQANSVHHSTAGRRCRRRFLLYPFDAGGVLVGHDPTTDLTMLSITVPPPQVL